MIVVKKMLLAFKQKKGSESLCGGKDSKRKRKQRDLLSSNYFAKPFRIYRRLTKESC